MEFPDLGQQCSYQFCKQLDFLPAKCDFCQENFCKAHVQYEMHSCRATVVKNVRVPTCPVCHKAVSPLKRGDQPNFTIAQHIQSDCKSVGERKVPENITNESKSFTHYCLKFQAYTNKCSLKKCKISELIPVVCQQCNLNFCLKHRHQEDHNCVKTRFDYIQEVVDKAVCQINKFNFRPKLIEKFQSCSISARDENRREQPILNAAVKV